MENTEPGGRRFDWFVGSSGTYGDAGGHKGKLFLYDRTAGADRIVVDPAGRVGVGTYAPEQRLHVSGGRFQVSTGAHWDNIQIHTDGLRGYIEANGDEEGLVLRSNVGQRILIPNANLGIGTMTPGARLHVVAPDGLHFYYTNPQSSVGWNGGAYSDDTFRINHAGGGARLVINNQGDVGIGTTFGDLNGPAGLLSVSKAAPSENSAVVRIEGRGVGHTNYTLLTLGHGSGEAFVVRANGNVGVGTATPDHKLSVNGSVRAREVIVETTGWADSVFADDYNLPSLRTTEQHIRKHKHLPGIPSAAQVAERGVSIGEMQVKLLAKIEELTLHAIEQQKHISELQDEVRKLKSTLVQP